MKIGLVALLRGTVVGIAFVATTMIAVFNFTDFRLPFAGGHGTAFVASAALALLLAVSYRKLWRKGVRYPFHGRMGKQRGSAVRVGKHSEEPVAPQKGYLTVRRDKPACSREWKSLTGKE